MRRGSSEYTIRPSRAQSLTRTTRSPSTRSWTIRSTAAIASRLAAEEARRHRRLDDPLAGQRGELPCVAEGLGVPEAAQREQRSRPEHRQHGEPGERRTGRRGASSRVRGAYDQGPIVAGTRPEAPSEASNGRVEEGHEMSTWMVRIAVTAVVGAALALSPAALAKDGVRVAGKCTRASTSKLKLGREDAGTEVEFEVDQNRNGVRWRVVLFRNGTRVASRTAVTRAPERVVRGAVRDGGRRAVRRAGDEPVRRGLLALRRRRRRSRAVNRAVVARSPG